MKDLNEALDEITAIRGQLVRTTEFRGYGPFAVAATGFLAIGAALFQDRFVPAAGHDITKFLAVWIATAIVAVTLIGIEMVVRSRVIHSGLAQEMIAHAVEQLVPAGVAGFLLTAVLLREAPDAVWMLPGLWQILLSLGICASARFLPRPILIAAGWYLLAGLLCLAWSSAERVPSPWSMGVPFGVGELLAAAILQWSQPNTDVTEG